MMEAAKAEAEMRPQQHRHRRPRPRLQRPENQAPRTTPGYCPRRERVTSFHPRRASGQFATDFRNLAFWANSAPDVCGEPWVCRSTLSDSLLGWQSGITFGMRWLVLPFAYVGGSYALFPEAVVANDSATLTLSRHPVELAVGYQGTSRVAPTFELAAMLDVIHRSTIEAGTDLRRTQDENKTSFGVGLRGGLSFGSLGLDPRYGARRHRSRGPARRLRRATRRHHDHRRAAPHQSPHRAWSAAISLDGGLRAETPVRRDLVAARRDVAHHRSGSSFPTVQRKGAFGWIDLFACIAIKISILWAFATRPTLMRELG